MCSGRRQISVVTCHPRESELCYLTDAVQATCRLGVPAPRLLIRCQSHHKTLFANERPLCARSGRSDKDATGLFVATRDTCFVISGFIDRTNLGRFVVYRFRQCGFERRGNVSKLLALGGSSMTCLRLVPDRTTITKNVFTRYTDEPEPPSKPTSTIRGGAAGYLQRLAHGYFRASEQLKFTAYRLVSKSIAVCILFLSRADFTIQRGAGIGCADQQR